MVWFFKEEGDRLKLVSGSSVFTVLKLERDDEEHTIKVYPVGDKEPCLFNLEEFDSDKSAFGNKLKLTTHSRGLFVKVYNLCREESQTNGEFPVEKRRNNEKNKTVTKGKSPITKERQQTGEKQTSDDSPKKPATLPEKTNKKMTTKKTSKSQYDNSLKMIGDCDIHITNLTEPPTTRLVRPVDPAHVTMLTEEFRKSSSQFVMLAGLIKDEDMPIDLETLKAADCGLEVETLGGNHTRIALQYLHAAGQLENGVVKVRIYHGLTDDEALEVGFMHNKKAELSKKMSFMDQSRLIKERLQNCPADRLLAEKKKLAKIFDKPNVTKLNQDYKAHLALGTKATDEIWDLAIELEQRWRDGSIKGGKKGQEVKQTIFKNIYSYNLEDEDRVELLNLLLTAGTTAYSKRLLALVDKNDEKDNKEMEEAENVESADEHETERATEIYEEMPYVDEPERQEDTMTEKDETIRQLKEENDKLKRENEELKKVVAEFEARRVANKGEKSSPADSNLKQKKNKALQNASSNENKAPSQKRKATTDVVDSFCVGDKVKAVWSGNKTKYDATVLEKHNNGVYTVRFYDGIVEKRSLSQMEASSKTRKL